MTKLKNSNCNKTQNLKLQRIKHFGTFWHFRLFKALFKFEGHNPCSKRSQLEDEDDSSPQGGSQEISEHGQAPLLGGGSGDNDQIFKEATKEWILIHPSGRYYQGCHPNI